MKKLRPSASLGTAALLLAALLLCATVATALHSHHTESAESCAACAFSSTPGDHVVATATEPNAAATGMVWLAPRQPLASHRETSLGSRGPPSSC